MAARERKRERERGKWIVGIDGKGGAGATGNNTPSSDRWARLVSSPRECFRASIVQASLGPS